MPKKATEDNLELFNLLVSSLSGVDDEEKVHIIGSVLNWFKIEELFSACPAASQFSLTPQISNARPTENQSATELSPKQFMMEKSPQTNVERIACLAFYLTHFRDTPHFKTLDISRLNTEAAQPKFSNASMTVNDAAKAGVLVPAGKGNKQLGAVGEQFVVALPDRDAAKAILAKTRKRKARKKKPAKK